MAAAVEQLAERQPAKLTAELVWGGDDHTAQLHERDPTGVLWVTASRSASLITTNETGGVQRAATAVVHVLAILITVRPARVGAWLKRGTTTADFPARLWSDRP